MEGNMNLKYKIALTMLATLNLRLYSIQSNINNNINNNNYFDYYSILPDEMWEYILDKVNLTNQTEIHNLLSQNIELIKKFDINKENIIKNENKIKELIKNFTNLTLVNKNFKELIYYIIKKFFNKFNKEQLAELLSILIKYKYNNLKIFAQIILNQNNIDLNNLNIPYTDSRLPIIIHAATLNNKAIIEFLIKNGANINIQDAEGKTSLMWTSCNNNIETVKLLIENGADLNKQDNNGKTALMWAILENNSKIVKFLIESNAKLDIQDNNGINAIMYALIKDNKQIINILI